MRLFAAIFTSPGLRRLIVGLALLSSPMVQQVFGEGADAVVARGAPQEIVFSPEIEKKIGEFLEVATKEKRRLLAEEIGQKVNKLKKLVDLDGEKVRALHLAADSAVDQALAVWVEKFPKAFRREQEKTIPDSIDAQIQYSVRRVYLESVQFPKADDEPAWTEGIARVLTPVQKELWVKSEADVKEALVKAVEENLEQQFEDMGEEVETAMLEKSKRASRMLALTPETAAKLDAQAKHSADRVVELGRATAKSMLLEFDAEYRKVAMNPRAATSPDVELELRAFAPDGQQAAWEAALAAALTPAEVTHLHELEQEKKAHLAQVFSRIFLAEMDRAVAFTARQREQLLPLCERIAGMEDKVRVSEEIFSNADDFTTAFPQAAAAIEPTELSAILDLAQIEHWEHFANGENAEAAPGADKKPGHKTLVENPSPEDLEDQLADFLAARAQRTRGLLLPTMLLKAEDAARISSLSPEVVARLQAAARGAVERWTDQWMADVENKARQVADGPSGRPLHSQLVRFIGPDDAVRLIGYTAVNESIWMQTVTREITEAQRAAWQVEIAARQGFQNDAIARYLAAVLGELITLIPEQQRQLTPEIAKILAEYSIDIEAALRSVRPGAANPWYFENYQLLPLVGLSDADLRSVLTNDQWNAWTASDERSSCLEVWKVVTSKREDRLHHHFE